MLEDFYENNSYDVLKRTAKVLVHRENAQEKSAKNSRQLKKKYVPYCKCRCCITKLEMQHSFTIRKCQITYITGSFSIGYRSRK